ncbi:MAG TPA: hypothetical protein VNZ22_03355 [Bacillota bacterium]|nr:hypothetical protein [Bacillota bacterium]
MHGQSQPWKFILFGDTIKTSGSPPINTNILSELANAISNVKPAFVLFMGDCAMAGSVKNYQIWTNLMFPVYRAGIGVYPTIGNHDSSDIAGFTNVFGPSLPDNGPEGEYDTTYALTYENALILVLNEATPARDYLVNQAWVNAVLATNTRPHVFAMGHYPAFKIYQTSYLGNYPTNRNNFWHSLSNAHGRIYFCSHDHFYDHSRLDDGDGNPGNDLHQFIVGTGGAPLYADGVYDGTNALWTPKRIFHEKEYGYVLVEVDGNTVRTTWCHRTNPGTYVPTDEVFSYSVASPPAPVLQASYSDGRLVLTWPGSFYSLQATPEVTNIFTNLAGATSPYTLTNLDSPSLFFRLVWP